MEGGVPNVTEPATIHEAELAAQRDLIWELKESIADLELAHDNAGWQRLAHDVGGDFSRGGRRRMVENCRLMAIANPLIKRGVVIRTGYVWGQGVGIVARAQGPTDRNPQAQDVNAVVQRFADTNRDTLTSTPAHETLERTLETDGNVYLAGFTDPVTGHVTVRATPDAEISDIILNPEDREDPWFYLREWTAAVYEPGYGGRVRRRTETRRVLHPSLRAARAGGVTAGAGGGRVRPDVFPVGGRMVPVAWDAPILHVHVNRPDGWKFGIPDVYAAVPWAGAYREFLTDWAAYTKALARYAWRATNDTRGKAQQAAAAARTQAAATGLPAGVPPVGNLVSMGPGQGLEAISKAGAMIDSDAGRPLAGMAAAALGLPVTLLLADPGVTGARAVAETLDFPTLLEMGMRRLLWQGHLDELHAYVIEEAVRAPEGDLTGAFVSDDAGREVLVLDGDTTATIEWSWPPLVDSDPAKVVDMLVAAHDTNLLPPLVVLGPLLAAIGVEDPDEIIAGLTDEDGNFIPPMTTAGDVAVRRFRDGEDPAGAF
jgi:hypothetical protein